MPVELEEGELRTAAAEAEVLIVEEEDRTRTEGPDPVGKLSNGLTDEDVATLKENFPILAGFSDEFIKTTPRGDLVKMQATVCKMKEHERSKDADDRLAVNKSALSSKFSKVLEGKDNRWTTLHSARFLGGAGCSATKLWLVARGCSPATGYPPIGNYDMGAVGMGGHVSARGWAELHNPQSTRLSVKLFSINNCGSRTGTKADSPGHHFAEDILDIGEFKLALRAMRIAFHFAMPWNFSIEALEGFFFQNSYCQTDLANVEKKAQLLTQFTDYVLGQNCERWRDSEPFLTTGELKATWSSFFMSRPQSAIGNKGRKDSRTQSNASAAKDKRTPLGICFAYNMGTCTKAAGTCTTYKGRSLKHICDFAADKSKPQDVCGKDHVRKDNH